MGVRGQGLGVRGEGMGLRGEVLGVRGEGMGVRGEGLGVRGQGLGVRGQGMGDGPGQGLYHVQVRVRKREPGSGFRASDRAWGLSPFLRPEHQIRTFPARKRLIL